MTLVFRFIRSIAGFVTGLMLLFIGIHFVQFVVGDDEIFLILSGKNGSFASAVLQDLAVLVPAAFIGAFANRRVDEGEFRKLLKRADGDVHRALLAQELAPEAESYGIDPLRLADQHIRAEPRDSSFGAAGDEVLPREHFGPEPDSSRESVPPASDEGDELRSESRLPNTSPAGQETLLSWPDKEEGRAHALRLAQLSDLELLRFLALAKDEMDASEAGTYVGLGPDASDTGLDSRGWVKRSRISTDDGPIVVARLTEAGREPARLLTALGDVPDYAGPIADRIADLPGSRDDYSSDDDIPF